MSRKRIDRTSRVNYSIAFFSKKNNKLMYCQSGVELGALYHLEFDRLIDRYQVQPETFGFRFEGKKRRYTPDLLILDVDGGYRYEEVKYIKDVPDAATEDYFCYKQWTLLTHIGVPLARRLASPAHECTRTNNLKGLYKFLGQLPAEQAHSVLETIKAPMTLGSLIAEFDAASLPAQEVMRCIANDYLCVDLDIPLAPSSIAEVVHG